MRLSNIKSLDLLPQTTGIADRLQWVCDAFDIFIKDAGVRRLALAAPLTLESIQALTDEELQEYYKELNLATYYPDIPRDSRERFLYEEIVQYRKLGTVSAIQALLQYIFGHNPISLTIIDNLAFDEDGVLTDESLLNLYDAYINIDNPTLSNFELSRIFSNITKFGRTSQKLRGIVLNFENDNAASCPVTAVTQGQGGLYEMFIENSVIIPYTPQPSGDQRVGYLQKQGQGVLFNSMQWMRNSDGSWQEIPGYHDLYQAIGNASTTFISMKDINGVELGVSTLSVSTVDETGNLQVSTSSPFNDVESITYQINWQ